VDVKTINLF